MNGVTTQAASMPIGAFGVSEILSRPDFGNQIPPQIPSTKALGYSRERR
jgi:hypothetical protein